MVTRSEPDYVWDFCGGDLVLDFTNTVGNRGSEGDEHFNVYGDVLAWAEARKVITRAEALRLAARAARSSEAAQQALRSLRQLRESLYRVISAAADEQRQPAEDLATLNAHLPAAYRHARLAPLRGRLALAFDETAHPSSLTQPIAGPVMRAAIDLLTTDAIRRVRSCADRSCAWLFVDATRSGSRRWCDMKVCGNRNKVRNFRSRADLT
jgi:predicted RNA-binding Zn ribbon-like protein